jgi:hypothetical protein
LAQIGFFLKQQKGWRRNRGASPLDGHGGHVDFQLLIGQLLAVFLEISG